MPALHRRDALRTIGLASAASVAGCRSLDLGTGPNVRPPDSLGTSWTPPADAWPFPHADLRNTARSDTEIPTRPAVEWRSHADGSARDPSVWGDLVAATPDLVITASQADGEFLLRAYDPADGTRLWRRRVEHPQDHRIPRFGGLVEGTVYATDGGTDVVAVDASDGTVRWRRNLYERVADDVPDKYLSASESAADFSPHPLATPETVYVQSGYGLHGLAPEDGAEQWRLYLAGQTEEDALDDTCGLAVTERRVWASYGRHVRSVFTVSLSDDEPEVERARLPLDSPAHPVVTSDRDAVFTHAVVWGTSAPETLAVGVGGRARDASWQFPGHAGEGAAAYSSPATDGERAFLCVARERPEQLVVTALRASTGKLEWLHRESLADRAVSVDAGEEFRLCRAAVAGDALVTGYGSSTEGETGRGTLVALSRQAGRVLWRTDLPIAPRYVAATDDRLFVADRQCRVVALAPGGS